jgi:hypothetical protein
MNQMSHGISSFPLEELLPVAVGKSEQAQEVGCLAGCPA